MERKMPIFADRFLELRGKRTQEEFAKFLGISRPTVGFYESGQRLPDALVLRQIAEKCNVSIDWLLGLSNAKDLCGSASSVCNYLGLSMDAVQAIHSVCLKSSSQTILSFLLRDKDFLYNLIDFLSSVIWDGFGSKVIGSCPPTKADYERYNTRKEKYKDSMVFVSSPSPTPIISPDAELLESICFGQIIKILTKTQVEFATQFKDSAEFTDTLVDDYISARVEESQRQQSF